MLKFLGLRGHPRSVVLPCLSVPPWPSSREGTTGTPSLGGRKRGCRAQSHVLPVVLHSWGDAREQGVWEPEAGVGGNVVPVTGEA